MDTQELEKLFELKEKGIITDNEKKKQLLNIESDIMIYLNFLNKEKGYLMLIMIKYLIRLKTQ